MFPVKRRGFEEAFAQSFLMLERLSIPDQETVVGLFRVNLTKIQGKYRYQLSLSNDIEKESGRVPCHMKGSIVSQISQYVLGVSINIDMVSAVVV